MLMIECFFKETVAIATHPPKLDSTARSEKPRPTPRRLLGLNISQTILGVSIQLMIPIDPDWSSYPYLSAEYYEAFQWFMILSWLMVAIAPYCLVRSIQLARIKVFSTGLMTTLILINGTLCALVLWRALDGVINLFNIPA